MRLRAQKRNLLGAASAGNTAQVRTCLDEGSDINWSLSDRITPLIAAAEYGHIETVRLLLDRGATIDGFDEDGMGALHHAVGGERVDMLELLLDRGASLNKALHIAVTWGDSVDIMKFILDRGAAIETVDKFGRTILMLAIVSGKYGMVQLLLKRGASIHTADTRGNTIMDIIKRSKIREEVIGAIRVEKSWKRVQNFVQFLHGSGFSSLQWNCRLGSPIQSSVSSSSSGSSSSTSVNNVTTRRAVTSSIKQMGAVLYNHSLCSIITSFIPDGRV